MAAVTPADPTRDPILEAAAELFAAFGLRRTSMEDVARKAGVGRTTLYRRYPDKDALIRAVTFREGQRLLDTVRADVEHIPDLEERMVAGFAAGIRRARTQPLLQGLLRAEPEVVLPYVTVEGAGLLGIGYAQLLALIREQQAQGMFRGFPPEFLTDMLLRMLHSILLTPTPLVNADDEQQVRDYAYRFLLPLLRAGFPGTPA
ncbi:MAG: TetR/AcrR family transcriptional regulator [Pseudomonadota bacterium]